LEDRRSTARWRRPSPRSRGRPARHSPMPRTSPARCGTACSPAQPRHARRTDAPGRPTSPPPAARRRL
jgi:hypothetical protein